MDLVDEYKANK